MANSSDNTLDVIGDLAAQATGLVDSFYGSPAAQANALATQSANALEMARLEKEAEAESSANIPLYAGIAGIVLVGLIFALRR